MARIRASLSGGSASLNLLSPDTYKVLESVSSGNTIISVTQKPRWIVLAVWSVSGSSGCFAIVDVTNNTAKMCGYWSSSLKDWQDFSSWTEYFTTVSNSQVIYNNARWGGAHRLNVFIYY